MSIAASLQNSFNSLGPLMNRWKIPPLLEAEIISRDRSCIYCGVSFAPESSHRNRASWEHILNNAKIVTRENIALCCIGCNASKGARQLSLWLQSKYCRSRGINESTIAPIARAALLARIVDTQSLG